MDGPFKKETFERSFGLKVKERRKKNQKPSSSIFKSKIKYGGFNNLGQCSVSRDRIIFLTPPLIRSLEQTQPKKWEETTSLSAAPQKIKNTRLTIIVSLFPILGKQFWPDIWFSFDSQVITLNFSIELFWDPFGPEYTIKCRQDTKVAISFSYKFCIKTALTRCVVYNILILLLDLS